MKTLLLVTDTWHPQVNGVVRSLSETVKCLEKRGFQVVLIHPSLFYTLPLPFYPEIRLAILAKNKIKRIIAEQQKIDFVHIATEGPIGIAVRSICKKKKIPFTTSYHTHFPKYAQSYFGIFSKTAYRLLSWFHNTGEKTMVSTESLKKELEKSGFQNVVVCPLGVDTDIFVKHALDCSPFPKPVFTYLGRVAKEKNVEEFLQCRLPGTKLVIGDGPERKSLEEKYKENTVFVGYKKGEELIETLLFSDVFVFPSRTETFGLAILEALSCGIPVAAYDIMGPRDILTNGVDGILDENLEKAALECLSLDRKKCREKALQFSWEKSVDTFVPHLVQI